MKATKKSVSLLIVLALALCFCSAAILMAQEDAHAAVSKAAIKKAKTYSKSTKKLFKVKGYWYCFSKKKVRKGLQKVGKNYYYFSKSTGKMYLKTGLKKVGTAYYYFRKKSGKAPALTNTAKKISGKVWFFKSNGKRYKYSYLNTGSASGNTAAGVIISGASIKASGKGSNAQLKAAYKKIVKGYKYIPLLVSVPKTKASLGKLAKNMTDEKGGKCFHFAALTYVTFKALGASPTYYNGKFKRPTDKSSFEHSWVVLKDADGKERIYDSNQDDTAGTTASFFGKLITYENDSKSSFTIAGKNLIYYPGSHVK